jgi:hypothetical protein
MKSNNIDTQALIDSAEKKGIPEQLIRNLPLFLPEVENFYITHLDDDSLNRTMDFTVVFNTVAISHSDQAAENEPGKPTTWADARRRRNKRHAVVISIDIPAGVMTFDLLNSIKQEVATTLVNKLRNNPDLADHKFSIFSQPPDDARQDVDKFVTMSLITAKTPPPKYFPLDEGKHTSAQHPVAQMVEMQGKIAEAYTKLISAMSQISDRLLLNTNGFNIVSHGRRIIRTGNPTGENWYSQLIILVNKDGQTFVPKASDVAAHLIKTSMTNGSQTYMESVVGGTNMVAMGCFTSKEAAANFIRNLDNYDTFAMLGKSDYKVALRTFFLGQSGKATQIEEVDAYEDWQETQRLNVAQDGYGTRPGSPTVLPNQNDDDYGHPNQWPDDYNPGAYRSQGQYYGDYQGSPQENGWQQESRPETQAPAEVPRAQKTSFYKAMFQARSNAAKH